MSIEETLKLILDRLDAIDEKFELMANPGKALAVNEKVAVMQKAIATGDRVQIRAANKFINGR